MTATIELELTVVKEEGQPRARGVSWAWGRGRDLQRYLVVDRDSPLYPRRLAFRLL